MDTTTDDIERICAAYAAGRSLESVAAESKRGKPAVKKLLLAAGVAIRTLSEANKGKRRTPETRERMREAQRQIRADPEKSAAKRVKVSRTKLNGSNGTITNKGYRRVLDLRTDKGSILEHRLVMEAKLGRAMLPHETIHHKNGDKADNEPSNLELWSKSQPPGQRVGDKLAWAKEIIRLYGDLPSDIG